jgi:hypothetical protein
MDECSTFATASTPLILPLEMAKIFKRKTFFQRILGVKGQEESLGISSGLFVLFGDRPK